MNWMNFLVNVMIPLGILLYMNIAIYKGMKKLHGSPIIATSGANGSILQDTQMRALRYLGLRILQLQCLLKERIGKILETTDEKLKLVT